MVPCSNLCKGCKVIVCFTFFVYVFTVVLSQNFQSFSLRKSKKGEKEDLSVKVFNSHLFLLYAHSKSYYPTNSQSGI